MMSCKPAISASMIKEKQKKNLHDKESYWHRNMQMNTHKNQFIPFKNLRDTSLSFKCKWMAEQFLSCSYKQKVV